MLRVGVTGGIGSGKTALTDWLGRQGITVVDADLSARVIVTPGQPALAEIVAAFGEGYLQPDGQLNRGARLVEILKQPQYEPLSLEKQVATAESRIDVNPLSYQ